MFPNRHITRRWRLARIGLKLKRDAEDRFDRASGWNGDFA